VLFVVGNLWRPSLILMNLAGNDDLRPFGTADTLQRQMDQRNIAATILRHLGEVETGRMSAFMAQSIDLTAVVWAF